jgi:ribulose-phosphate 3-epimerase
MGDYVSQFDPSVVDLLHLDVMDGNFVPNITFGPGYIKDLQPHTSIPLDVHLMIEKPENSIGRYLEMRPWCVTIHYESTRFPARALAQIRDSGVRAGISINPATPVEVLYDLAGYADLALIMSVDPGFYGQPFMPEALGRIRRLKTYIDAHDLSGKLVIQVDGGISRTNIAQVAGAGARIIVAGNAVFSGGEVNKNARELKEIAGTALPA